MRVSWLDRRGHGPADRLDELRRQIAGDREEAVFLGGIHDRQLAALQRVAGVGVNLVHHVDHRIAAGDQQAGLAIGREVHVAGLQRAAEGAAHRLFAHVLHVERGLALPLCQLHPRIEGAQRHHVAQPIQQLLVAQQAGPGADRLAAAVQHADDGVGEFADLLRLGVDRRAGDRTGLGDDDVGEVRRAARADGRLRHMKGKRSKIAHRGRVSLWPPALLRRDGLLDRMAASMAG